MSVSSLKGRSQLQAGQAFFQTDFVASFVAGLLPGGFEDVTLAPANGVLVGTRQIRIQTLTALIVGSVPNPANPFDHSLYFWGSNTFNAAPPGLIQSTTSYRSMQHRLDIRATDFVAHPTSADLLYANVTDSALREQLPVYIHYHRIDTFATQVFPGEMYITLECTSSFKAGFPTNLYLLQFTYENLGEDVG